MFRPRVLDFRIHIDPDVPRLCITDSGRVRQILLNLTGNAVKFTARGFVELSVSRPSESSLCFVVRDSGVGIANEDIPRLFEPFTQVDSSDRRTFGGTGLGLSISKKLLALLGGTIEVESAVGVGSLFRFHHSLRSPAQLRTGRSRSRHRNRQWP
jgi:signal transduction histidine kinase